MDIILTNTGGQPIYDQIVSQIKAQILSGKLKEGDALPSLRTLARDLRISVITTKRSFVAGANTELIREEHLRLLEDHLREAVALSHLCNLDLDGLTGILSMLYKEEDL